MEHTYEQLEEKYKSLPADVRQAISSSDIGEKVMEIAQNHDLMLDKADELAEETSLVMLGLTHPNEFVPHLRRRLGVPDATVNAIANEINEQIFKEIRESLKKIHENPANFEEHGAPEDREDILNSIENPIPSSDHARQEVTPSSPTQEPVPTPPSPLQQNSIPIKKAGPVKIPVVSVTHAVPQPQNLGSELGIAEAKLNNPVVSPNTVEIKKNPIQDPYRESIG